ncbi:cold-shock protein [Paenibacillus sp. Leaf72]|uniref:cold-shock protein n=1 Tax=Paenibacillus sp. Leaf72 TaxID=1736234 RepID=UPI000A9D65C9
MTIYSRKKFQEEVPEVSTKIWACTSDVCNGWMRANFSFEQSPTCLQCNSPMEESEKMLPQLVNSNDINRAKNSIPVTE